MSEETPEIPEATAGEAALDVDDAEYVCPLEFDSREELCKMFVGGLEKDTTDEDFKSIFEKFGEIKEAVILRKNDTKNGRLFGFVTFAKCDNLDDCLLARPHKHKERALDVKRAIPKGQNDAAGQYKVKKLHLGNIPPTFDKEALLKYLKSRHPSKYGTIDEVDILKEKDESGNLTDKNRGFGFITVSNEDLADRISIAESKFTLDGVALRINKAKPKGEAGGHRGGYRGKGQNFHGAQHGDGSNWSDWGYGGYGYGGYGYGDAYGYGGYDYGYGYPSYGGYGPPQGRRFAPY